MFNPKEHRMIEDVIVPSHFFKIIYFHNRRLTYKQVVLAANTERRPNSIVVTRSNEEAGAYINLIQKVSGILFNEWRK